MFEVIPPQRRASEETIAAAVEKIKKAVDGLGSVDFINLPEIIEENYAGAPLHKNLDNAEFASLLGKKTKIEQIVNKVTPHFHSNAAFESWLEKCIKGYGLHYFVFVGGNGNGKRYEGPSVIDANRIAASMSDVKFGNICIPSRDDEVQRLVAKSETGASFFTTQIIFESKTIAHVLEKYATSCETKGIDPAVFYVSLAPVGSLHDIEFFKWLGAEIPERVESRLKNSGNVSEASVAIAAETYAHVVDFAKEKGLGLQIEPNVETISNANLNAACKIVNAIRGGYVF